MTNKFRITKAEAAGRQLAVAIQLLFECADPVVIHTIAGAASILYTDLLEASAPEKSWDVMAQDACGLGPGRYFNIMREAQNFLKHARHDPGGTLDFDPIDTESLIFCAVMNASEFEPMSIEAQVFQLWYIASHWPLNDPNEAPFVDAVQVCGDLRCVERSQRLAAGQRVLKQAPLIMRGVF